MRIYKLFLILSIVALWSCAEEPVDVEDTFVPVDPDVLSEINQGWLKEEQFLIDQFVENNGLDGMIETESGLRYLIYERDSSATDSIRPGNVVWMQFEIAPMGDTVVYRSDSTVAESFLVNMDYVENGLHEAVTYFRTGDKVKVILPSHLAHGLLGDQNKIPPLTAVYYDLKVVAVE